MSLYLGNTLIDKVSVSFTGSSDGENTYDATLSSGYQMLEGVTAYSKGQKYTGQIPSKTSNDVTANDNIVTVPSGYYSNEVQKTIPEVTVATPSITVSNTGLITANINQSTGYVVGSTKSATKQLTTKGATTITPTSSVQTVVNAGTYVTGDIKVAASSGSSTVENGALANPTINTSTGIVTSSVSKAGYIDTSATTTLQLSTQAAKTITPSSSSQTAVSAGKYTTGNITVAAVPTETKSITANGTYTPTSGKWFSSVDVNVPEKTFNTQTKTVTPNESKQTISPDSGYDGLSSVTVNAISSTYVGSGITKKAAETIVPSTTDKTIASGQYLNGAQTIKGDSNLVASNIISGKTIFGVSGNVVIQHYYTGSSEPSSSLGSNGDIYLKS